MKNDNYLYLNNKIRTLIKEAFSAATDAHEQLFKDSTNKQNELVAGLFLNKSITLMTAAKTLHYSLIDNPDYELIESIFHKFSVFENEFLTNISTDHSHQWTDIEFNNLKDDISQLFG